MICKFLLKKMLVLNKYIVAVHFIVNGCADSTIFAPQKK